jgi:uncharacterized OsmC-like protein
MAMATTKIKYKGSLRTQAVHVKSGKKIITDAPVDNNGKGEAFSPTDLLATSLVSCMITIMGIYADKNGLKLGKISSEMTKIMAANPRRVSKIEISINCVNKLSKKDRKKLEKVALACPVAKSIHPDIALETNFNYSKK